MNLKNKKSSLEEIVKIIFYIALFLLLFFGVSFLIKRLTT
jgi:hypothetical protein